MINGIIVIPLKRTAIPPIMLAKMNIKSHTGSGHMLVKTGNKLNASFLVLDLNDQSPAGVLVSPWASLGIGQSDNHCL